MFQADRIQPFGAAAQPSGDKSPRHKSPSAVPSIYPNGSTGAASVARELAPAGLRSNPPFVIEDSSGRIVGRANLKSIHSPHGCAEVGYRIDQRVCGQGLATQALKHLIEAARMRWELTQLVAYVYESNVGSRKVLERCGFVPDALLGSEEIEGGGRFVLSIWKFDSRRTVLGGACTF
ncbi:GNAT family N-acetyltransferase [Pseudomonas kilonensis]|uniref:Acetyltransferase (GNAT) domain-containing protein n=1 Tax=Pseudomonas kilonensis TaxID=132476 RepID=A0ABY0ZF09_9PSED|nr:GNAT family N-acetyltransferase [Pseudomonas kilonensis]SEE58527.1 Acetyltransferase (GNAT) domain-containing protein [Pseudomonas kilonensis]